MNLKCAAIHQGTCLCDHDACGNVLRAMQILRHKQDCGEHMRDVCPAGKTSSGDHDASGIGAVCDATPCEANEKGVSHASAACPADKPAGASTTTLNSPPFPTHTFR